MNCNIFKNMDHPLKGLWLIRYYQEGTNPCASVMDMGFEDAVEHNEKYGRYSADGDSGKYIRARADVEGWVVAQAKEVGIKPENRTPLYFLLSKEREPNPPIRAGQIISIPADQIPSELVSFTFDDSFYNYIHAVDKVQLDFQHPLHGNILNAAQLADHLRENDWLPSHEPNGKTPRYIEAQIWSRRLADFVHTEVPVESGDRGLSRVRPAHQHVAARRSPS